MIVAWVLVDPFAHLVFLLDVEKQVNVGFNATIPVSAKIKKDIEIQLPQQFSANILIDKHLTIPLDETLEVPLNMTVTAPVEADVLVDQVLDLNVDVPIDVVLTPKELTLEKLRIPLDTELFVDDTVQIETTLPVKIRVKDEITVAVKDFRAPLKMVTPIRAQVPVKQMLHIVGTVKVSIQQTLPIHVKKVIGTTISDAVPVSIAMGNKLPISLEATFDSDVKIEGIVPIQLGTLHIKRDSVRVKVK